MFITHFKLLMGGCLHNCVVLLKQKILSIYIYFFKDFIYLFLEKEGREKERKRNTNAWLPLTFPLVGTWPATQACALTENRTGDPLVRSWHSIH